MTPYLAVIKDSFRAAMHGYVLWALVLVVTFMLALLLPFSYAEQAEIDLEWDDVTRWHEFATRLYEASQEDEPNPGKHIWGLLDQDLQEWVANVVDPDVADAADVQLFAASVHQSLQRALNRLYDDEEFYNAKAWEGVELTEEGEELVSADVDTLDESKLRRRNRLLTEAAFPQFVLTSEKPVFRPTYAGKANSLVVQLLGMPPKGDTREAVVDWYEKRISVLMNWPVTFALVFAGIIATSGIIPRMLDHGSITLLLSKPVSRTLLFLSQYVGGCAFMLLAATYFIVGVWLLAGIRLGVWSPKMFLCIPLFLAIFMVYYAVSAIIGMVWRSSVVSVIVVVVFFYACFGIGTAKTFFEDNEVDPARLKNVYTAGNSLLAQNDDIAGNKRVYFWNEETDEWLRVFDTEPGSYAGTTHAVFQPQENRLAAIQSQFPQPPALVVGQPDDGWSRQGGIPAPAGVFGLLLSPEGDLVVVSGDGFWKLTGDPLYFDQLEEQRDGDAEEGQPKEDVQDTDNEKSEQNSESEPVDGEDADSETVDDSTTDIGDQPAEDDAATDEAMPEDVDNPASKTMEDFFISLGPDAPPPPGRHVAVNIDGASATIVVYSGGAVRTYRRGEDGKYQLKAERIMEDERAKRGRVAIGGGFVVLGLDDGQLMAFRDDDSLSLVEQVGGSPEREVAIAQIQSAPDGEWFSVLFENRQLYLIDAREDQPKLTRAGLWSQGEISSAQFTAEGNLLVVDKIARVRELELPGLTVVNTYTPQKLPYLDDTDYEPFGIELNYYKVHRFFVTPLYTILPRVGELGWFFRTILTGEETQVSWFSLGGEQRHLQRNPWAALWSCGIFVCVLLAYGCWRMHRAEF